MSKYEEYIKWLGEHDISKAKIEEFNALLETGDMPKTQYAFYKAYCDGYNDGRKDMLEIFGSSNVNLKKENDELKEKIKELEKEIKWNNN